MEILSEECVDILAVNCQAADKTKENALAQIKMAAGQNGCNVYEPKLRR